MIFSICSFLKKNKKNYCFALLNKQKHKKKNGKRSIINNCHCRLRTNSCSSSVKQISPKLFLAQLDITMVDPLEPF